MITVNLTVHIFYKKLVIKSHLHVSSNFHLDKLLSRINRIGQGSSPSRNGVSCFQFGLRPYQASCNYFLWTRVKTPPKIELLIKICLLGQKYYFIFKSTYTNYQNFATFVSDNIEKRKRKKKKKKK